MHEQPKPRGRKRKGETSEKPKTGPKKPKKQALPDTDEGRAILESITDFGVVNEKLTSDPEMTLNILFDSIQACISLDGSGNTEVNLFELIIEYYKVPKSQLTPACIIRIMGVINGNPEFKARYEQVFGLVKNPEKQIKAFMQENESLKQSLEMARERNFEYLGQLRKLEEAYVAFLHYFNRTEADPAHTLRTIGELNHISMKPRDLIGNAIDMARERTSGPYSPKPEDTEFLKLVDSINEGYNALEAAQDPDLTPEHY